MEVSEENYRKYKIFFSEFWILCSVDRAPVLHEEYSQL